MSTIIERLRKPAQANGNGNSKAAIAVSLLTVTPTVARELLELNVRNRPLNEQRVKQYARMMSRGEWHDAIADVCIDTFGVLTNGQHCLNAVVISGETITVTLKTNLQPQSQDSMDSHRARKVADQLQIEGFSNATTVAGSALTIMRWREEGRMPPLTSGGAATFWKADRLQHLNYCRDHRVELEANAALARSRNKRTGLLSPVHIAVLQVVFNDAAPQHAAAWTDQMFDDSNAASQPVFVYKNKLIQLKGTPKEWSPYLKYAFAVKSFNAFMARKELKLFRVKPDEKVSINVPEGVN